MRTVTFDTNIEARHRVVSKAIDSGWHVAFATVSLRETHGTEFEISIRAHPRVPELGTWEESAWDEARWADEKSSARLEGILHVISDGSFPKRRSQLTKGQLRQLRDAMILEAHSAARRDFFVTRDHKAFVGNGRREQLEALANARILSPVQFEAELATSDEEERGFSENA